ncbi:MAG: ParB/RepB/Spo0J family partition protein [Aquamicrobium sp.]|nr:ParB/RepB/Spo0J family partition protein [Aquamicrobium sp.]
MQSEQLKAPFHRLMRDETANVRKKHSREAIEEMKASILAHDIIQPVAVRPPVAGDADLGGQLYRIFAGGRRWLALGELVQEGKLQPDHPVPIIIRDTDDATATELSLAENLIREAMSPADEFRAFLQLVDGGKSIEDVALHFGRSERYVKGRLALAKLHPEILAAFEADKINFTAACAYTTNPDQDVQLKHFIDAGNYYRGESWAIKNAMQRTAVAASSALAGFVGEETYRAAGGIVVEDLFGEGAIWTSIDLLPDLKAKAVDNLRAEALAEGWSFFATTEELSIDDVYAVRALAPAGIELTEAETDRMDEISDELEGADPDEADEEEAERLKKLNAEYEALEAKANCFSAEQVASTGIVFDTKTLRIRRGCLKPEAKAGADGDEGDDQPLASAAKATKDPLALTQPLKDKIGETATVALKTAVVADPHRALALIASMLEHQDERTSGIGRPTRLEVERVDPYAYGASADKKSRGIHKAFDAYTKKSGDELLAIVASLFAKTIDLTEKWFQKDYTKDDIRARVRSEFMTAFAADPVAAFDAEAWFSTCTKPMIDAAMKEMTGNPSSKLKKADMAREATEKARETGWLPAALRLKGYALKGKKPAPAGKKQPPKKKEEAHKAKRRELAAKMGA